MLGGVHFSHLSRDISFAAATGTLVAAYFADHAAVLRASRPNGKDEREVIDLLRRLRGSGESYSDVLVRLVAFGSPLLCPRPARCTIRGTGLISPNPVSTKSSLKIVSAISTCRWLRPPDDR
jgi:hypothetical protein